MNERDYIREVDELRASEDLRNRIAALPGQAKRRKSPRRWMGLCACLAVVLAGAGVLIAQNGGVGGSAGGAGHDEGSSTFMSYAGPVFPLSVLEDGAGLTAQRDLTWDFAPWAPRWISNEEEAAAQSGLTAAEREEVLDQYNEWFPEGGYYQSSTDIQITDTYTLTNTSGTDRTVCLLYPFAGSFRELAKQLPTLTADGAALDADLIPGPYSGGFRGVTGSDARESINLRELNGWEGYKALLESGDYLGRALAAPVDLSTVPVTVYKFTDPWGPAEDSAHPNPTIRATFTLDYDRTTVLSYGFNGGSYDPEGGAMGRSFSIPGEDHRDYGRPYYLVILGEDVRNMALQGYSTGGWDTQDRVEAGADTARYQTDLDTALREIVALSIDAGWSANAPDDADFGLFYPALCEQLCAFGVLSPNGAMERYGEGCLEDLIGDTAAVDRVFYLSAQVTIPAGGSVTITAASVKEGSFDHYCAHTENQGVYGYGLVPKLGTTLDFTALTAWLENTHTIEIVRQNMGFDPEHGLSRVELDPGQEHYYLEVRKAAP